MRARRSSLVIVAAAALAGLAAVPVVAQQDPKQKEIDDLRRERNELQDRSIEQARRFDEEKQRLQVEKEEAIKERARLENEKDELLREIQRLRMGAGAGVPAAGGDPLSRAVSLELTNAPLTAAFRELGERLGCKPALADGLPAKTTVTVRFKDLPGRIAVDLVCWNARAAGRPVDLAWRIDEGTLTVERAEK